MNSVNELAAAEGFAIERVPDRRSRAAESVLSDASSDDWSIE